MIVTCPQCAKRYMLDDELLPKQGRQVRCISCLHIWLQVPEISPPPRKLSCSEPLHTPIVKRRKLGWLKWGVSFTVIFAGVGGLIVERHSIVEHFPQARKLYTLLGLPVNSHATWFTVANTKILYNEIDAQDMMVISGDLTNVSGQVKSIPPLKLKLIADRAHFRCAKNAKDKACVVDQWDHRLSESFLLPGETIHFETHSRPKIEGVYDVSVEF